MEKTIPEVTISLVVPAAGCGARAALNGNKILALIHGRPLLWWTLRRLTARAATAGLEDEDLPSLRISEVVIAVRDDERATVQSIWDETDSPLPLKLACGGESRQASVASALKLCTGDLVAVHDAARPMVTAGLLDRVARAAWRSGAAIPAAPASDTVKKTIQSDGRILIESTVLRETIWLAQTPQVFRREIFEAAFLQAEKEGFDGTDCASLVERLHTKGGGGCQQVVIVSSTADNFKVTYGADLERAAALLNEACPIGP
jgi:2-C-methyl-D-erythritol 4-phosphate cytidylyltransferase